LIVDDAAIESALLARMLASLGHEVVGEASLAAAALDLAVRRGPDLAIVDGRFPPLGGLAMLEALRRQAPAVRVAVIASLAEIELVRAAVAAGASGALRRPLLRSAVAAALSQWSGPGTRSG
jgi:DNA-binding NarL/FixJ family response regulator